jgi:DNA polymerase-3 subunit gamma/tau
VINLYQALYRKYRPLIFSDVSGQSAITDTLRSQVSQDMLSHAYLFTGTRGTGKTTCAKILARAANCLSPMAGNPCNTCAPCIGALEGSLLDVIEIDAASNSGVDNIRSLRDEAAFVPTSAKKRVYIIDEVHMLSTGAFNALLKTLEEPPPHVLFILATTETHKVPATILSRCQRFAFKRLTERDIAERLMFIAEREKLALTEPAAALLARLADGAMRDGVSLLDQVAAIAEGSISEDKVYQALGLAGDETIGNWAETIANGDVSGALAMLSNQIDLGRDIASLLGELSQSLRDVLLSKLRGLPVKQNSLSSQSTERVLYMLSTVQDTLSLMSHSPQPRTEAELCVIKLCGVTMATPVVGRDVHIAPLNPPNELPNPMGGLPSAPTNELIPSPEPQPIGTTDPVAHGMPTTPALSATPPMEGNTFKSLAAAKLPPSLKSFLLSDQVEVEQSESMWKVIAPDDITLSRLSQPGAIKVMEEVASDIAGHAVSVRVSLKPEPKKNPKLQLVLDNFNS